jgi:hypothetical protein
LASMAWLTASASCWGLGDESDEDDDEVGVVMWIKYKLPTGR